MPGARCARSLACSLENTRVSHHGHTGNTRHSPRNGFNGYFVLSRVTGFLATLAGEVASTSLTPASGRQDHTTSPSARWRARQPRYSRPPHSVPNVRDDRETPLWRAGTARK